MEQGAIAQLGERLLCKQEVVGSIPSGSTIHCIHGVAERITRFVRPGVETRCGRTCMAPPLKVSEPASVEDIQSVASPNGDWLRAF